MPWLASIGCAAAVLAMSACSAPRTSPRFEGAAPAVQGPPAARARAWAHHYERPTKGSSPWLLPTPGGGILVGDSHDDGPSDFSPDLDVDAQGSLLALDAHGSTLFERTVGPPESEVYSSCFSLGGLLVVGGIAGATGHLGGDQLWIEVDDAQSKSLGKWRFPVESSYPLQIVPLPDGGVGLLMAVSGWVDLGSEILRDPHAKPGLIAREGWAYYVVLDEHGVPRFVLDLGARIPLLLTVLQDRVVFAKEQGPHGTLLRAWDLDGKQLWEHQLDHPVYEVSASIEGGFHALVGVYDAYCQEVVQRYCSTDRVRMTFDADGTLISQIRLPERAFPARQALSLGWREPAPWPRGLVLCSERGGRALDPWGRMASVSDAGDVEVVDASGSSAVLLRLCLEPSYCEPRAPKIALATDGGLYASWWEQKEGRMWARVRRFE